MHVYDPVYKGSSLDAFLYLQGNQVGLVLLGRWASLPRLPLGLVDQILSLPQLPGVVWELLFNLEEGEALIWCYQERSETTETKDEEIKSVDHLGFQVLGGLVRVAEQPLDFLEQLLGQAAGRDQIQIFTFGDWTPCYSRLMERRARATSPHRRGESYCDARQGLSLARGQ